MSTKKITIKATLSLASILSIRMLGLFMILPILALYTNRIPGASAFLIGLALGIYGFTQSIFQIPFGLISDHIGRKKVIALGLLIFLIGSLIAAFSGSIYGLIFGRALQGMGAIGSTVMALLADFVPATHRSRSMAILGMTIGLSFIISIVAGPLLNNWIHLKGIFILNALLAATGILIVLLWVPSSAKLTLHEEVEAVPNFVGNVLKNPQLIPLYCGIFFLHAILTATFLAIPLIFHSPQNNIAGHQWLVYLSVLIVSFLLALPLIITSEKKPSLLKNISIICMLLIALSQIVLFFSHNLLDAIASLTIFFIAFNFFEATLPSQVSKIVSAKNRGTAMGIFSTSQFLGIFFGGITGGWISQHFGLSYIFIFCTLLIVFWIIIRIK